MSVGPMQQFDLRRHFGIDRWRSNRVQGMAAGWVLEIDSRLLIRTAGDERRRPRRPNYALRREIVCVGVAGALAGDDPYAAARRDTLSRRLDQRLVEAQGSRSVVLEVKIGVIASRRESLGQVALQIAVRKS